MGLIERSRLEPRAAQIHALSAVDLTPTSDFYRLLHLEVALKLNTGCSSMPLGATPRCSLGLEAVVPQRDRRSRHGLPALRDRRSR